MTGMSLFGMSTFGDSEHEEFFERAAEFGQLNDWLSRLSSGNGEPALLTGQRGVGKSLVAQEWLRQTVEEHPADVVPFFYAFQPYAMEAALFARSYFSSFVLQYARRRAPRRALSAPRSTSWDNLRILSEEARSSTLSELIDAIEDAHKQGDYQNYLNLAISAPHWVAKLERIYCPVILDNAELMQKAYCGDRAYPLWPHFQTEFQSTSAPHMFCGSRPSLRAAMPELFSRFANLKTIEVRPLDVADSMAMIKTMCNREGLEFNIEVAEQMASQLRGIPFYIKSLIERIKKHGRDVETLLQAQRIFAEEISEGAIHWFWRSILQKHFPSLTIRQSVLKLCHHLLLGSGVRQYNFDNLCRRFSFSSTDFDSVVQMLQVSGIMSETFGTVRLIDDSVLFDVITAMHWGDIEGMQAPAVVERLTQQRLMATARLMQRKPSQQLVGSLQRMLNGFTGQHVPIEWFRFSELTANEPITPATPTPPDNNAKTLLRLPVIIGTISDNVLDPAATPPPFEDSRPPTLISFGFYDGKFLPNHEMIWLTSIFAGLDTVTSEEVRTVLKQKEEIETRYQAPVQYIWLIGGKTFTPDALELASRHRMFTSNLDMVQRLSSWIMHTQDNGKEEQKQAAEIANIPQKPDKISATEYEIEIPIAPDMELLAAQSLEQVAQLANCDAQTIAKLKMALLEAALNVVNYKTGADKRVKVKFEILDDRLNMTVQNSTPVKPATNGDDNTARGLKLMNKLVDLMSVETLPNGTRINLTCFRRPISEQSSPDTDIS